MLVPTDAHCFPRPHTVHASTAFPSRSASSSLFPSHSIDDDLSAPSDGALTPRGSDPEDGSVSPRGTSRRMSRDDTATDLHVLAGESSHHPLADSVRPTEQVRTPRVRKTRPRMSSHSTFTTNAGVVIEREPGESTMAAVNRICSKEYKESIRRLRELGHRRAAEKASDKTPSTKSGCSNTISTVLPESAQCADPMCIDLETERKPPTSPSKRSAKQVDDRPRKQRFLSAAADELRKDTPAPSGFGLPLRSANGKSAPVVVASGGESARRAAHNINCRLTEEQQQQAVFCDWPTSTSDVYPGRPRIGSISSSAADSAADLSCGSDTTSTRDHDGDLNMEEADQAPSRDFAVKLPPEIALSIFEYLDAKDLLQAEKVNRRWNAMARDTQVWRTVFLRRYQRHVSTDPAPIQVGGAGLGRPNRKNQEWRKMYKARVDLEQNWRAGADNAGKAVYLSGHTDSVYCVQFDEEKIITGSRDRTIRVWDINTYQCLKVIGGPNTKPVAGPKVLRTVDYPAFHMATASVNGTAYGDGIYHVPTEWHDASILCLQYDDKILVTGSSDSDLLIWDIKTYQPIKRLRKHTGGVLDVALDAKHIVSCSKDSRIIVWDRETLQPKGDLTGHRGPVNAVQLRGHLLVSASGDGIARLWDLNKMKLIKEFSAKERGLAAVEFSEDMKYVLAGGNDNITYKFETDTGREVMQFTGHSQLVRSLWLDSANDRVVSGSYDLDLRVYDFVTGEELWRGEEWTTSWMLAAKSDYRRIVATSQDGRILLVDFGIYKGAPNYSSRDGSMIANLSLLRGTDHTTEVVWRTPQWSTSRKAGRIHQ